VLRLPISAVRSTAPVLSKPGNRKRTVSLTPKQWHYAFTNTLTEKDSKAAYARYHVPAPGRPLFQVATANIKPGAATKVNFGNDDRAPLLLIAAEQTTRSRRPWCARTSSATAGRRLSPTFRSIPDRSHFTAGSPGWEEVADYALRWCEQHQDPAPRG
jgi:alpha-beta hydrolase superfamily lysophospholipase